MSRPRVAVVGAGVAGLTAALRLTERGWPCDVYERWPGLGGQAATVDVGGGHRLERYYHHLFTSDHHIAGLYDELGMGDELEWRPSSVAFFANGKQYPFVSALDLLRFKPLSPLGRVRMGAAVVALQRMGRDRSAYEGITARAWIERWMGRAAWDAVWGPLLRGKFGSRAEEISMVWLWSKLTVRRQIRGEEARTEMLGYPRGSWETLLERLRERIESGGGRVLIDRPAAQLDRDGDAFVLTPGRPDSFRSGHDPAGFAVDPPERYEKVVATVPNAVFERLLSPELAAALAPGYLDRLRSIEYHTALCLLLEVDRPLSPYYWTNIADAGMPFLGLIEHTNFVPPERYDGRRFLYVANYVSADDPVLGLSLDELLDRYEPGLRKVNLEFDRRWIRNTWLFQEPAAQPVVTVGYHERIPPLRTGVPGLVLANTTQVYPEDRGTNYAVRLGGEAADVLVGS